MAMTEHFKETQYGFEWGAVIIERQISDKNGVQFVVRTPRQELIICVTPTGLIRVGEPFKSRQKGLDHG